MIVASSARASALIRTEEGSSASSRVVGDAMMRIAAVVVVCRPSTAIAFSPPTSLAAR